MTELGQIGAARYDYVDEWPRKVIGVLWSGHELVLKEMYPLYDSKFHLPHERKPWLKERREWFDLFRGGGELDAKIIIIEDPRERIEKEDAGQWAELVLHYYEDLKTRCPNGFAKCGFILDRYLKWYIRHSSREHIIWRRQNVEHRSEKKHRLFN
jgi:hypothetical protein